MSIVSVSLDDELLEEVDGFVEEQGFSGRSEVFRTALRSLMSDRRRVSRLEGVLDAVLMVTVAGGESGKVDTVQHRHQEIVTTQLHNHLEGGTCLEVFVVHGKAEEVQKFYERLQSLDTVNQVKMVSP